MLTIHAGPPKSASTFIQKAYKNKIFYARKFVNIYSGNKTMKTTSIEIAKFKKISPPHFLKITLCLMKILYYWNSKFLKT